MTIARLARRLALLTLFVPAHVFAAPGFLDGSFGDCGMATTVFGPSTDFGNAVAVQADGRVVVAGVANGGNYEGDVALARFDANGVIDGGFGTGGRVRTDLGMNEIAQAVLVQPDGKIVIAGLRGDFAVHDFLVGRYNADGSPDGTFGSGGFVTTDFGGDDYGYAVVRQPDGKLVVAGGSIQGVNVGFELARYTTSGALDPTFGSGGKVTTLVRNADRALNVLLQPDGKIVAAGQSIGTGSFQGMLARYGTNGALDPTFGSGGTVVTALPFQAVPSGLARQSDGKLVLVGQNSFGGTYDAFVARYDVGGTPDASFGGTGYVVTDYGTNFDRASGVVVLSDGTIVTAGDALEAHVLAAYQNDGSLDATFGNGGIVVTTNTSSTGFFFQTVYGVTAAFNDLYIVGYGYFGHDYVDVAVARYHAGAVDHAVLGQRFLAKDGGSEDSRKVIAGGKDQAGALCNVGGNPVLNGATLRVATTGTMPADQIYVLDAAGWKKAGKSGFKYKGPTGGDGDPVKAALIKTKPNGRALVKVVLSGKAGTQSLDVVPPNLGDDVNLVLDIGNGDRYCLGYGGAAGGIEVRDDAVSWQIKSPTVRPGCIP